MRASVSVDLRYAGLAGINVFARELWRAMAAAADAELHLLGLVEAEGRSRWPTTGELPGETAALQTRAFLPTEQLQVPWLLRRRRVAVHHSPHFNVPYLAGCPIVLTVHDLFPLHEPSNARSRIAAGYYRVALPAAIRRADVVVAVSAYTAADVIDTLHTSPDKVRVIEHGLDRDRWRRPHDDAIAGVRRRYALDGRFLLYVGTGKRHKNLATLMKAHQPDLPPLVLVGCSREEVAEHADVDGCRGRVRFLGRVADADLPALYAAASATLLPSRYEAVGLTVWESMACGTPVIASTGGGLPATAGDAALLVDPDDVDGWSAAMRRVSDDDGTRQALIAAGLQRTEGMSWQQPARRYLRLYRELAAYSPSS